MTANPVPPCLYAAACAPTSVTRPKPPVSPWSKLPTPTGAPCRSMRAAARPAPPGAPTLHAAARCRISRDPTRGMRRRGSPRRCSRRSPGPRSVPAARARRWDPGTPHGGPPRRSRGVAVGPPHRWRQQPPLQAGQVREPVRGRGTPVDAVRPAPLAAGYEEVHRDPVRPQPVRAGRRRQGNRERQLKPEVIHAREPFCDAGGMAGETCIGRTVCQAGRLRPAPQGTDRSLRRRESRPGSDAGPPARPATPWSTARRPADREPREVVRRPQEALRAQAGGPVGPGEADPERTTKQSAECQTGTRT